MATKNDLHFVENNDPLVTFTLKSNGAAFDLTGSTIELYAKDDLSKADDAAGVAKFDTGAAGGITLLTQSGSTLGQVTVQFTSAKLTTAGGGPTKALSYHLDRVANGKRVTHSLGQIDFANV